MYAALWRHLPGPLPAKILACLALAALVATLCFTWLFPWIAAKLPVNDPNISGHGTTTLTDNRHQTYGPQPAPYA